MRGLIALVAAFSPLFAAPALAVAATHAPLAHMDMIQIPKPKRGSELIGGQPVGPNEYPGVFYTRQGATRCTGTLIGSRVLASAAHCIVANGTLTLTYRNTEYSGRCMHAPLYPNNESADWALCLLSRPIPDPIAEWVNTESNRLASGGSILLMGYGCTRRDRTGGNDGALRAGTAPIIEVPTQNNFYVMTTGAAALCSGDSGGPGFYFDQNRRKRYQIGINSRGNIATTSYLSALHVRPAQDFFRSWADQNSVKICGIHGDAQGCRQ